MVRLPSFDSNGIKKGLWSEEEDAVLRDHVLRFGHPNWRLLPSLAGLPRCGKSCRLRWVNYLKPGIKKGHFSKEEEDTIIKFHAKLGKKWSDISKLLPGRTDNDIKNYWHAHIKKRSKRKHSYAPIEKKEESSEIGSSMITIDHQQEEYSVLSAENPKIVVPIADQCDLWSDPLFYDQTCFINQDLPPFPEEEFFYLGLCRNDMSAFSDSSSSDGGTLNPSPASDIEMWVMSMLRD